jgi:hypothetical protein
LIRTNAGDDAAVRAMEVADRSVGREAEFGGKEVSALLKREIGKLPPLLKGSSGCAI